MFALVTSRGVLVVQLFRSCLFVFVFAVPKTLLFYFNTLNRRYVGIKIVLLFINFLGVVAVNTSSHKCSELCYLFLFKDRTTGLLKKR